VQRFVLRQGKSDEARTKGGSDVKRGPGPRKKKSQRRATRRRVLTDMILNKRQRSPTEAGYLSQVWKGGKEGRKKKSCYGEEGRERNGVNSNTRCRGKKELNERRCDRGEENTLLKNERSESIKYS